MHACMRALGDIMLDVKGIGRAGRLRPVLGMVFCVLSSSVAWSDEQSDCDALEAAVREVTGCKAKVYGETYTRDKALERLKKKVGELCAGSTERTLPNCDQFYEEGSKVPPRELASNSGDTKLIEVVEAGYGN